MMTSSKETKELTKNLLREIKDKLLEKFDFKRLVRCIYGSYPIRERFDLWNSDLESQLRRRAEAVIDGLITSKDNYSSLETGGFVAYKLGNDYRLFFKLVDSETTK